jgi:chaperonin cofactor prefoldin
MDIRSLLNKLDSMVLSEAITLKDVAAAVQGKEKDEQGRAEILNDLAWKNKLPGLYDPISGYFVGKQSQPNSMGGRYNIAASGSERSDRALSNLGLIPDNAKTSTALGRAFRGDDKDQYSQDIKNTSNKINKDRQTGEIKADKLPKLKALVDKLKSALGSAGGLTGTAPSQGGLNVAPVTIESSIFESLLREFQEEIVDEVTSGVQGGQGMMAPAPGNSKNKDLVMQIQALIDELSTVEGDKDIEAAIADAQAAIKADVDATNAANKASTDTTTGDNKKIDPAKLARFKELLAKAGAKPAAAPTTAAPAATAAKPAGAVGDQSRFNAKTTEENTLESMAELIARVQRIAEGTDGVLAEALTPEEKAELDALAKELETFTGQDPELDGLLLQHTKLAQPGAATTDKPAAGANAQIQAVQQQLLDLGITAVGKADGKMGPMTAAAVKQFQQMAGITVDGKIGPQTTEALKNGKQIVAKSEVTTAITAIEQLLTKYKVAEDTDLNDMPVEEMNEDQVRKFVLSHLNKFTLSEQMEIMKLTILSEADSVILGPDGRPLQSPGTAPAKPAAPAGGGVMDKLKGFAGAVKSKIGTGINAVKSLAGSPKKMAVGAIATLLTGGVTMLLAKLKGGEISIEPADKAVLEKNLNIINKYTKDPEMAKVLPDDLRKRVDAILAKAGKLSSAKTAAAPAAAPAPGGNIGDAPAA